MTARQPPAVPPLGDAAVSRIERGVVATLDRDAAERARPWAPAAGRRLRGRAVALTASALAALALLSARHLWRGSGLPARGARIATAASPSHVTVEGAAIDVAPSSAITFAQAGNSDGDGATVIRLERGTVTCEVAPRGERAPFVVEAGTTRVTVVGTRFGVTRVGDHAQVWVAHGTVEVGDDGVTRLVHAGERYLPGTAGAADSVAREDAPEAQGALPVPAVAIDSASAAPPPSKGARAPVAVARVAFARSPDESPRTAERSEPLSRLRERARERADLASGGARGPLSPALSPAEAGEETGKTREPPAAGAASAAPAITSAALRERFESAAALEVRDPLAAFRIYRELASGSGPWAANALFAEARLSAERGQRDAAHALLSAYLERFPAGPNADDARALLGRLKGGLDHDGALR